jgi:DNA-binding NtrC family response regulator
LPPSETAPRESGSGTILVVEDDADVRGFVGRLLEHAGYRVLEAQSSADAVRIGQAETIQLLLTDVVMPGMNGPEVASRLTLARPGLRVLFMSGHTHRGVVVDGVPESDVQLLAKPFTSEALLGAVQAALAAEASGQVQRTEARH